MRVTKKFKKVSLATAVGTIVSIALFLPTLSSTAASNSIKPSLNNSGDSKVDANKKPNPPKPSYPPKGPRR